jgi:hypothetical protein
MGGTSGSRPTAFTTILKTAFTIFTKPAPVSIPTCTAAPKPADTFVKSQEGRSHEDDEHKPKHQADPTRRRCRRCSSGFESRAVGDPELEGGGEDGNDDWPVSIRFTKPCPSGSDACSA